MTKQEWLDKAKKHQNELTYLISNWHPTKQQAYGDMTITAPASEIACGYVRDKIIFEDKNKEDAVLRFNKALAADDINTINKLLNDVWFGVPESRDCWQIKGFKEAVDLMEDFPE